MSTTISNSAQQKRALTIRFYQDTFDEIETFIAHSSSDLIRTLSKAEAVDYLVAKALKAEKGEQYVPLNRPSAV